MSRKEGELDFIDLLIRGIVQCACKIDDGDLEKIPSTGPLIIMVNHVNFLEVPILYLSTLPRKTRGLAKQETLNVPLHRWLAKKWNAILIDRSGKDRSGLREAEAYLASGGILFIAPEGTRSKDGILQEAHAGIISLAARTGAPILPVAHFGAEKVWPNLKRLRRTEVHFRVGGLLNLKKNNLPLNGARRRGALREAMGGLASLLPSHYRGFYQEAADQIGKEGFSFFEVSIQTGATPGSLESEVAT